MTAQVSLSLSLGYDPSPAGTALDYIDVYLVALPRLVHTRDLTVVAAQV